MGAVLTLSPANALTNCSVSSAEQQVDAEERTLLNRINQYRADHGKPALSEDSAANRAAAWMSRDMANKDYFASNHVDSLGRGVGTRLSQCDVPYGTAGENLAAGNPGAEATFQQWRTSPGHNENMLNGSFTRAGIARAQNPNSTYEWYWTLDLTGSGQNVTTTTVRRTTTTTVVPTTTAAPTTTTTVRPTTTTTTTPPPPPSIGTLSEESTAPSDLGSFPELERLTELGTLDLSRPPEGTPSDGTPSDVTPPQPTPSQLTPADVGTTSESTSQEAPPGPGLGADACSVLTEALTDIDTDFEAGAARLRRSAPGPHLDALQAEFELARKQAVENVRKQFEQQGCVLPPPPDHGTDDG